MIPKEKIQYGLSNQLKIQIEDKEYKLLLP